MTSGDPVPSGTSPTPSGDAPSEPSVESSVKPSAEAATETPQLATQPATEPGVQPSPQSGVNPGPLAARGLGVAKPGSPTVTGDVPSEKAPAAKKKKKHKVKTAGVTGGKNPPPPPRVKVAVPNIRHGLAEDIQAELDAELAAADVDAMLSGSAGMPDRKEPLEEGARVHGQILKIHQDSVFVALGGPDEGVLPFVQFTGEEPEPGQSVEVIVRGLNSEDGLYVLTIPGQAVDVADWGDLDEGSVVEATVTGHNAGGLECKVGGIKGFIPISQVTEYRVEDLSEFADQKFVCLVTEANTARGNLVLSRRAILEREREEKRKKQLEEIEPGDTIDGTVRSIKDFGAFVDLGGLDGLIHVSKLSWDRVKHPSEVLEVGQAVTVQIDSVDKETAKIGLSYRDLQDNPWDDAEAEFSIGSMQKGTVTRIANLVALSGSLLASKAWFTSANWLITASLALTRSLAKAKKSK